MTAADGGRSRITGALRLGVSVWLIASAVAVLADPQKVALEQPELFGALLRVAGLSFTLGFFLLTGFMSRVAGVLLALVSGWQIANLGCKPAGTVHVQRRIGIRPHSNTAVYGDDLISKLAGGRTCWLRRLWLRVDHRSEQETGCAETNHSSHTQSSS